MSLTPAIRAAIERAAREEGVNPAFALAVAERESNFNPSAHNSKTIHGMFQMRSDLRHQYGIGDSEDAYTQAKGWAKFINQTKGEMSQGLGRAPTDSEAYAGHHFGSGRAAQMLTMNPDTPVSAMFSPYERSINPHFDRAGTVGRLNSSVLADMNKRAARFGGGGDSSAGGDVADFSSFGKPYGKEPEVADFSSFGTPYGEPEAEKREKSDFASFGKPVMASNQAENLNTPSAAAASAPDFSSFGTPL